MANKVQMDVRVEPKVRKELDDLAKKLSESKGWLRVKRSDLIRAGIELILIKHGVHDEPES